MFVQDKKRLLGLVLILSFVVLVVLVAESEGVQDDKDTAINQHMEGASRILAKREADGSTTTAKPKGKRSKKRSGNATSTTKGPAKTTTNGPATTTTNGPAKTTTNGPSKSTTNGPAKTTTKGPSKSTTNGPAKATATSQSKPSTTTSTPNKGSTTKKSESKSTTAAGKQPTTSSPSSKPGSKTTEKARKLAKLSPEQRRRVAQVESQSLAYMLSALGGLQGVLRATGGEILNPPLAGRVVNVLRKVQSSLDSESAPDKLWDKTKERFKQRHELAKRRMEEAEKRMMSQDYFD